MGAIAEVRRVDPGNSSDVAAVVTCLTEAFSTDPVLSWLLPQGAPQRRQRMTRLWSLTAHGYLRRNKPVHLTSDGCGAALWAPPGTWLPTTADVLRDLVPMAYVFRGAMPRAQRLQGQLVPLHPRQPKHWYLYAVGARSAAQGRGVGTALLREGLDVVDRRGDPAYLESSNIRNVPLYERHGFEVVEEVTIAGGGPTVWRMWRDPQ